jgi:hypothetical protein
VPGVEYWVTLDIWPGSKAHGGRGVPSDCVLVIGLYTQENAEDVIKVRDGEMRSGIKREREIWRGRYSGSVEVVVE